MALRADVKLDTALLVAFTAQAAVTKGRVIKYGTVEGDVLHAAAGEQGDGVALEDAVLGAKVTCAMANGGGVALVVVGTGGATHGSYAVAVADGVTDAATAIAAGGATADQIVGKFTQTGVAGDEVGMQPLSLVGLGGASLMTFAAQAAVVAGRVVKLGTLATDVLHAGAGEQGEGVAINGGGIAAEITVALAPGGAVPALVGTGGATHGAYAVVVADGVTDAATILAVGTTAQQIVGKFLQTGSATASVGMIPMSFVGVSA